MSAAVPALSVLVVTLGDRIAVTTGLVQSG